MIDAGEVSEQEMEARYQKWLRRRSWYYKQLQVCDEAKTVLRNEFERVIDMLDTLINRCPVNGIVYFISDGTHIKIGYSQKDPAARLKSLQTGNAQVLELLAHIQGSAFLEQQLHTLFGSCRVRGEWFALSNNSTFRTLLYQARQGRWGGYGG